MPYARVTLSAGDQPGIKPIPSKAPAPAPAPAVSPDEQYNAIAATHARRSRRIELLREIERLLKRDEDRALDHFDAAVSKYKPLAK